MRKSRFPGWRTMTAAQRYNAKKDAIFDEARRLGALPRAKEWSGYPDPSDPDNYWIDDETGERVNAQTGERT